MCNWWLKYSDADRQKLKFNLNSNPYWYKKKKKKKKNDWNIGHRRWSKRLTPLGVPTIKKEWGTELSYY